MCNDHMARASRPGCLAANDRGKEMSPANVPTLPALRHMYRALTITRCLHLSTTQPISYHSILANPVAAGATAPLGRQSAWLHGLPQPAPSSHGATYNAHCACVGESDIDLAARSGSS